MSPRQLELADEFCRLVGASNLLEYLDLPVETSSDSARSKLKARRRYMQGMQSNPKYKSEALFLIKNFGALESVLANPVAHVDDMARRQESVHLPILEMTIEGALRGGALSAEQVEYLHRNATELGVSEGTFDELLARLAARAGVALPGQEQAPAPEANPEPPSSLVVAPSVSVPPRRAARASDPLPVAPSPDPLLQTGPPARERAQSDPEPLFPARTSEATTAPPIRPRTNSSSPAQSPSPAPPAPPTATGRGTLGFGPRAARLEVLGEPVRHLKVGNKPLTTEIRIRNGGDQALTGRISTDEPWLIAQPSRLDPSQVEQTIAVLVLPRDMYESSGSGAVTIHTDTGERVSVVFEVERQSNPLPFLLIGGGVVMATLFVVVAVLGLLALSRAGATTTLTITVDPTSERITLNGQNVGSGTMVEITEPPLGSVEIVVIQSNYKTFREEIYLEAGARMMVPVSLQPLKPPTFRPAVGMRSAPLDQDEARNAVPALEFNACFEREFDVPPGSGVVSIYIGRDGLAEGVEIEGPALEKLDTKRCLERRGMAVRLPHPLPAGYDFAPIRYRYSIGEGAAAPEQATP